MSEGKKLVSIRGLTVSSAHRVLIKSLDLDIAQGELLGIAGESGSGKTMLMRTLLNIPPEDVHFKADALQMFGADCLHLSDTEWRRTVGEHIGFVPQNTMFYLHPMLKIRQQIADSYVSHRKGTLRQGLERAEALLREVGFDDPERVLNSYAWELSGGMRQRVNIAMALMNSPELLIADEPTTALDCAIQRQIMDLFMKISRDTGIAVVMISHDLGMLQQYSRRTLVMYAGRMVESGSTETLFCTPAHPYTRALMGVIPSLSLQAGQRLAEIPGYVPDSGRETDACIFAPRCPYAGAECSTALQEQDLGGGHNCLCAKPGIGGQDHG